MPGPTCKPLLATPSLTCSKVESSPRFSQYLYSEDSCHTADSFKKAIPVVTWPDITMRQTNYYFKHQAQPFRMPDPRGPSAFIATCHLSFFWNKMYLQPRCSH